MANYDEDSVVEALARLQPALSAIEARILALEAGGVGGRVVYDPPLTIVQTFEDGSVVTYNKAP